MAKSTNELWESIAEDPGNPAFADLAEQLRGEGKLSETIEVCLAGLSSNPSCFKGRLVLARAFLQKGFVPFAQREIEQLCVALPDNTALQKLADKLDVRPAASTGGTSSSVKTSNLDSLVAEAELNFDDIELIEK